MMNRTQEDIQYRYKYRSLDNFRNFIDILVNKRLYGAKYDSLNDPFEGSGIAKVTIGSMFILKSQEKLQ